MCIFARQLRIVLHQHNRHLGSLYTVRMGDRLIHPKQIERLKRAADGDCSKSVTLNPQEIEAIERTFALTTDDIRRLRAALIAEALYRLVLGRIAPDKALELSELLFGALFKLDDAAMAEWRAVTLDEVRSHPALPEEKPAVPALIEQQIEEGLEPAIGAYEEGILWLNAAHDAIDDMRRRGFALLAASLLNDAKELIDYPLNIVEGTPQQADWREVVAVALNDARLLAEIDT